MSVVEVVEGVRVAHCPGHGEPRTGGNKHKCDEAGSSTGTRVGAGVTERDWSVQMARDVIAAAPWMRHRMLRSGKVGTTYAERAVTAGNLGTDLVLCHHVDASDDPNRDGLACFVLSGDELAAEVASAIMRASPAELRTSREEPWLCSPDDWTKRAGYILTKYMEQGVTAVLIEWGFGTSPVDLPVLRDAASRPAMAVSAAAGLARMLELLTCESAETHEPGQKAPA